MSGLSGGNGGGGASAGSCGDLHGGRTSAGDGNDVRRAGGIVGDSPGGGAKARGERSEGDRESAAGAGADRSSAIGWGEGKVGDIVAADGGAGDMKRGAAAVGESENDGVTGCALGGGWKRDAGRAEVDAGQRRDGCTGERNDLRALRNIAGDDDTGIAGASRGRRINDRKGAKLIGRKRWRIATTVKLKIGGVGSGDGDGIQADDLVSDVFERDVLRSARLPGGDLCEGERRKVKGKHGSGSALAAARTKRSEHRRNKSKLRIERRTDRASLAGAAGHRVDIVDVDAASGLRGIDEWALRVGESVKKRGVGKGQWRRRQNQVGARIE